MATHTYVPFLRDPTDVVGRRIAAFCIDWGIAAVMFLVLALSLADTREFSTSSAATSACDAINEFTDDFCVPVNDIVYVYDGGDAATMLLLPLLYQFLNDALLTGVTGFSIGKGLVGLRVVRQRDGRLAGVGRCTARWAMWIADSQPCGLPIVGLITGLTSKGHRRVGDMVAGTFVVDKHDVGTVPVVPGLSVIAPAPGTWHAAPPPWGSPPAPWGSPPPSSPPPSPWGSAPPQQWGAPAPPQPWGHSAPSPVHEPPSSTAGATPGVGAPVWDDARDTYIQWDPELSAWVQWDETSHQWHVIPTD